MLFILFFPDKTVQNKKLRKNVKANDKNLNPPPRAPPAPKRTKTKLRRGKAKKTLKITGLDLLHSQTLLSTSPQGFNIIFFFSLR